MAKKIIAVVLAMAMLLAFAGCHMAKVNTERDNAQVIIEVGDRKILKGDIAEQYNSYLNMYASMYGLTVEEFKSNYADTYNSFVQDIVDSFVELALVEIYAEELNVDLSVTEEQNKEIEEKLQSTYKSYEEYVNTQVDEDDTIAEDKKAAEKEKMLKEALDAAGYNDGSMREELEQSYKIDNMKDWLVKDYKVTDDMLEEFYNKYLQEQKTVLDKTPSSITTYEADGEVSLYVPQGLRYMQVLYVPMTDEDLEAISEAEDDAKEAVVEAALKNIKSDADKALKAANDDFTAAIETYADDATKNADDNVVRTYSGDTAYPAEVTEKLFKMKQGEVSGLIETDKGYYIIKYTNDMTPGVIALLDVKDELKEKMIDDNREDTYTSKYAEWKDAQKIVTYLDRL